MNEYAGVTEWTDGIPIELPVDVVRRYVQAETLTLERFDLLQAYFEKRIIKALDDENDLEQLLVANVDFGKTLERDRIIEILLTRLEAFDCATCGECVTPNRLVALIKGENK